MNNLHSNERFVNVTLERMCDFILSDATLDVHITDWQGNDKAYCRYQRHRRDWLRFSLHGIEYPTSEQMTSLMAMPVVSVEAMDKGIFRIEVLLDADWD